MLSCLIKSRNCLVSNYGVTINYIYNNDKVVDMSKSFYRYFICIFKYLCCVPFCCIKKLIAPDDMIYNM